MNFPLFLAGLLALTLHAEGPETPAAPSTSKLPSREELKRPVLSPIGRKRLEENVKILDLSLKDLRENLVTTERNLETIQGELRDLNSLERDHLELRQKYEVYLVHADQEMKKNEQAKRDLAKWEESAKGVPKDATAAALRDRLEAARLEKADRDRWKWDADAKAAKVKELLSGIDRNLADIRSRRKPLESQLAAWSARRNEYQKMVSETETKKAQWERTIVR